MFKLLHQGSGELFYATQDSSGFDIPANEDGVLAPGEWKAISTGLFNISGKEERDFIDKINKNQVYPVLPHILITPRSGLAADYGVTVLNSPGRVDFDYLAPNEIKVILINLGRADFPYKQGDRIAQGECSYALRLNGITVKQDTRTGGLGSTGVTSGTT